MQQADLICFGCGVPLQTEEEKKPGYVPEKALDSSVPLCRRCFRLRHYSEAERVEIDSAAFLDMLHKIGETKALVVKIVDIFDFNGSWLHGIHRFAGGNDILLVANKIDLLPRSVKLQKLKHWLKTASRRLGVVPCDIYFMSALKGTNIEEVAAAIDRYRGGRDVYVVGATNVGKSSFIKRLIEQFGGDEELVPTVSPFPGTTLNFLDFPLDDGKTLYDTPGVVNNRQLVHRLSEQELRLVTPKKEMKPKVYQLNSGQTLFFGALARFDYIHGGKNSFVCYAANSLYIHRTKLKNADELYETQKGELLIPPFKGREAAIGPLVSHEFAVRQEKTDLVVSGLGWVTIHQKGATVRVHAPKGVEVARREALI